MLGELGDVYGLVVYLGTDGLNQYKAIQSGEVGPDGDDAPFFQNCLKVSFEDRNELSKDDLEVIRGLELSFRGPRRPPRPLITYLGQTPIVNIIANTYKSDPTTHA